MVHNISEVARGEGNKSHGIFNNAAHPARLVWDEVVQRPITTPARGGAYQN